MLKTAQFPLRLTVHDFRNTFQGRKFADVLTGSAPAMRELLRLISLPDRQIRLDIAEEHFERPAIAGVVVELEQLPAVVQVLEGDPSAARRFRQAAGAAVRILMEGRGWQKTGIKAAVGVGKHFRRAERYVRGHGPAGRP